MNMEKLSLEIAEKHILCMTDDNYEYDCFLNTEKITSNIENGFVVITQLSCYFESFLNTIINSCMNYDGETLLKCSIKEKIDLIFMHYQKDWGAVKGQNHWEIYRKVTRIRNDMIHFKKTFIGIGTGMPNFQIGKQGVAEFFTKKNMTMVLDGYIKLTENIASTLELTLHKQISIFESNGRDGLVNYVYDDKIIKVDESRFK